MLFEPPHPHPLPQGRGGKIPSLLWGEGQGEGAQKAQHRIIYSNNFIILVVPSISPLQIPAPAHPGHVPPGRTAVRALGDSQGNA